MELFDECYKTYPENFKYPDKEDYAWTIYNVHVKSFRNEKDFFNSVNLIINLVDQKNLRKLDFACVYASAIFKLVYHLRTKKLYNQLFLWLNKLDPKTLNPFPGNSEKSKRELYYDHLTFAYFATGQYEKCI